MSNRELLLDLLKTAVSKCYANDKNLIDRGMERASVARIYYYMQEMIINEGRSAELRRYNLDSEYNKNGEKIKDSPRFPKGMIPDIVLHERGSNNHNLLVVEFKSRYSGLGEKYKNTNIPRDFVKLEDFTNNLIYDYFLGVFVKLYKKEPKYQLFQNAQEIGRV